MLKVIDVDLKQEDKDWIIDNANHFMSVGRIDHYGHTKEIKAKLEEYINVEALVEQSFTVSVLKIKAGRNSTLHKDIYRNLEGKTLCRTAAINFPIQADPEKSYLAVHGEDKKAEPIIHYFGNPVILKTDVYHQGVNKESDIDRVIVTVSFFNTTYDELVDLYESGNLFKQGL